MSIKNRTKATKKWSQTIPIFLGIALILCFCQSCFTGIEGTKKITLNREDKKMSQPTEEENYISGIKPSPLLEWEPGRIFIASDNKALLIFDTQDNLFPTDTISIKGKLFEFVGVESKMNPAGNLTVCLLFTDGARTLAYDTNKEFDQAMNSFMSSDVPMMIDSKMVEQAREKLVGKKFWTKSPLWYDEKGERIDGKKFVEVTILEVEPGTLVFPLRLKIKDEEGVEAYMFMNFGSEGNESRSFNNLFSLTDIKQHYPTIQPETWQLISEGKVKVGMTKEECKLSLGNPSDVNAGHDYSQTLDIWQYDNGVVLWFEDGRLARLRQ